MLDADVVKVDEIDALGDQIGRIAGSLAVGTHRLLTAIGHFDAAGGWIEGGATSCGQWLSWKVGMGKGEAREKVRVARALRGLPEADAAFGRGELSYSKVRAVTRVATADNEALLLDIARYTTGQQLERVCRRFRRVVRASESGGARDRVVTVHWRTSVRTQASLRQHSRARSERDRSVRDRERRLLDADDMVRVVGVELDPEDLRAYADRPWGEIEAAKRRAQAEHAAASTVAERIAVAERLRRAAVAARPDWPSAADRAADLAAHVRLAELLSRAADRLR